MQIIMNVITWKETHVDHSNLKYENLQFFFLHFKFCNINDILFKYK
jgi:hypothetical protein